MFITTFRWASKGLRLLNFLAGVLVLLYLLSEASNSLDNIPALISILSIPFLAVCLALAKNLIFNYFILKPNKR